MLRAILHIGLPKTATSTIQHVTERSCRILSPSSARRHGGAADLRRRDILTALERSAQSEDPGRFWLSENGQAVARIFTDELRATGGGDGIARLSWENLASLPSLRAPAVHVPYRTRGGANLATLDSALRAGGITSLRFVVTIRSQADLLAATYAQIARTRRRPGQRDFERFVRENLQPADSSNHRPLSVAGLIEDLERISGTSPFVFPMERLGTSWAASHLSEAFEIPDMADSAVWRTVRLNSNRVSLDRWRMHLPHDHRWRTILNLGRRSIRLKPETRRAIEGALRQENVRLAEMTGLPLAELGYPT